MLITTIPKSDEEMPAMRLPMGGESASAEVVSKLQTAQVVSTLQKESREMMGRAFAIIAAFGNIVVVSSTHLQTWAFILWIVVSVAIGFCARSAWEENL